MINKQVKGLRSEFIKSLGKFLAGLFFISVWVVRTGISQPEVNPAGSHNINYRILAYDQSLKKYVPFLPSDHPHRTTFLIPLKRQEFPGTFIQLGLPENSHLFINGKYFYSTEHSLNKLIDNDSLFSTFRSDTLFLGFYLPDENSQLLEVSIVPKESSQLATPSDEALRLRSNRSGFRNFLIVGFLIIAGYIAFLLNYDRKLFAQYTNAIKMFSGPEADDLLDRNKPVAGTDLLFLILEALIFGFFIYMMFYGMTMAGNRSDHEFFGGLFSWFGISLVILVWIFTRFNLVRNLSYLMQVRDIGKVHFIESSRFTLFMLMIYIVLSLIFLFGFNMEFSVFTNFLIRSLIIIAVFRFAVITIKILNYAPYKKMYIISYLCASELIPVVLGLKLILDSSLATWVI